MLRQKKNNMKLPGGEVETALPSNASKMDLDSELLALLDQVCESGEPALAKLDAYMEKHPAEAPYDLPDITALMKDFKEKYFIMFSMSDDEAE